MSGKTSQISCPYCGVLVSPRRTVSSHSIIFQHIITGVKSKQIEDLDPIECGICGSHYRFYSYSDHNWFLSQLLVSNSVDEWFKVQKLDLRKLLAKKSNVMGITRPMGTRHWLHEKGVRGRIFHMCLKIKGKAKIRIAIVSLLFRKMPPLKTIAVSWFYKEQ